jgi:hydroxymethylglutaryl-CoA lyase
VTQNPRSHTSDDSRDITVFPGVTVVEVGPRDGLQNEATVVSTAVKVELIERMVAAGASRIEVVSFVRPDLVPQVADAEEVVQSLRARGACGGTSLIGLVLNRRGLSRAIAAGVDEINIVVSATDAFSRRNQGVSAEEMLSTAAEMVTDIRARSLGATVTISTALGCPFEGEVAPDKVADIAHRMADAGATEIAIADTIGVGVPVQVRRLVRLITEATPSVELRAHFHNTRNTGYVNTMAAYEAGVRVLDASVGGFGGCPFAPAATGNIATEDLLYLLHRSGISTGISSNLTAITGRWLAEQLGVPVPSLVSRAGGFPNTSDR